MLLVNLVVPASPSASVHPSAGGLCGIRMLVRLCFSATFLSLFLSFLPEGASSLDFSPPGPRWTFSGPPCSLGFGASCGACFARAFLCRCFVCLVICSRFIGAETMPFSPKTAGEIRRAAERSQRPGVPSGRPVTAATSTLRERYWEIFTQWAAEEQIPVNEMLASYQQYVDEWNIVMVKFGRALYAKGKTYTQFAETINSLADKKPPLRRLLQGAWDVGYSWNRMLLHHNTMWPCQYKSSWG